MNRLVLASGTVLVFAFVAAMQGCSSSDSGTGGSGNAPSAGTGNNSTGGTVASTGGSATTGGTSAGGTSSGTTGGTSAGGTSSGTTGGTSAGGAAAGGAASGGSSGAATGGTPGGTAGTTGGGTPPAACDATVAKGNPCTAAGSTCAKTCGINKLGYKVETCGTPTTGLYGEGACTYAATTDLTCYKETLPLTACPGVTDPALGPLSGKDTCTVPDCMPCGPNYQDGGGAKVGGGACVCTGGKWQCASAKEWPPQ